LEGKKRRNPKVGTVAIHCSVPIEAKEQINQLAAADSRSMSNYLVVLINKEFKRMEKQK